MRPSLTQRGFRQLQRLDPGSAVVCLSILSGAGGTLRGILAVNPPVELPSDLIEDRREKALLEVERRAGTPALSRSNRLKDAQGNLWEVWVREDNPATFTVKYWLVKLVSGLDQ